MPQGLVKGYVYYYTQFVHGWWNSCWGHKDVMETEEPEIAYGSDGEPYWVTGIATPAGSADQNKHSSLTGLMYTDARTEKSILYRVQGGTAEAVVDLVNNRVSYRKLHGCLAQCYNIYGVMTAIVPLLGESHSFQGVAFVDVANMQVAEGDDEESALLKYQQLLTTSGIICSSWPRGSAASRPRLEKATRCTTCISATTRTFLPPAPTFRPSSG